MSKYINEFKNQIINKKSLHSLLIEFYNFLMDTLSQINFENFFMLTTPYEENYKNYISLYLLSNFPFLNSEKVLESFIETLNKEYNFSSNSNKKKKKFKYENNEIINQESILINRSNILLEIIFNSKADVINIFNSSKKEMSFIQIFNEFESKFKITFNSYKDWLLHYNMQINSQNQLVCSIEKNLIDKIDNQNIETIIWSFNSSKSINNKENIMSSFAIKMLGFMNNEFKTCLEKTYKKEFLKQIKRECNGYFRHTIIDGTDKELSNNWNKFNENEKLLIMNKTISIYLCFLATLKEEGFLEDINKVFK
ncbi:MAG: hypothetical protein ACRDBR_02065 [Metamycoplasmataceae bacterium]